eukprot:1158122-Pelagomonas_calceolata.AAC.15
MPAACMPRVSDSVNLGITECLKTSALRGPAIIICSQRLRASSKRGDKKGWRLWDGEFKSMEALPKKGTHTHTPAPRLCLCYQCVSHAPAIADSSLSPRLWTLHGGPQNGTPAGSRKIEKKLPPPQQLPLTQQWVWA